MNKKQLFLSMLPYFMVFGVFFYVLPLVSLIDPQAAETGFLAYMIYIFNPTISFVLNIIYCIRNGVVWFFPIFAGLLFLPTVWLFFNQTALIYVFSYIVLGYIGLAAGYSMIKNKTSGSLTDDTDDDD